MTTIGQQNMYGQAKVRGRQELSATSSGFCQKGRSFSRNPLCNFLHLRATTGFKEGWESRKQDSHDLDYCETLPRGRYMDISNKTINSQQRRWETDI